MPFTDLLRVTVFLTGAEATALGVIGALAAGRENDSTTILVAAAWWLASLAIGLYLGRPSRAADGVRDALAGARTATSLPAETPARIALGRLWPIGATAVIAGGLGVFFPGVAVIGADLPESPSPDEQPTEADIRKAATNAVRTFMRAYPPRPARPA